VRPWARCRARWCWDRSGRWRARSSDIRRAPRSRIPGEQGGPPRAPAPGGRHKPVPALSNKPPSERRRCRSQNPPKRSSLENPCRRCRGLTRRLRPFPKRFDTSGKSPAYPHHRKSCKSPRRRPAAGFLLRRRWALKESSLIVQVPPMIRVSRSWFVGNVKHGSVILVRGADMPSVPSKKSLTRRANHRHILIIARTAKSPRRKPAAGFCIWIYRIGRRPHFTGAPSPQKQRIVARRASKRAAVRTP